MNTYARVEKNSDIGFFDRAMTQSVGGNAIAYTLQTKPYQTHTHTYIVIAYTYNTLHIRMNT